MHPRPQHTHTQTWPPQLETRKAGQAPSRNLVDEHRCAWPTEAICAEARARPNGHVKRPRTAPHMHRARIDAPWHADRRILYVLARAQSRAHNPRAHTRRAHATRLDVYALSDDPHGLSNAQESTPTRSKHARMHLSADPPTQGPWQGHPRKLALLNHAAEGARIGQGGPTSVQIDPAEPQQGDPARSLTHHG